MVLSNAAQPAELDFAAIYSVLCLHSGQRFWDRQLKNTANVSILICFALKKYTPLPNNLSIHLTSSQAGTMPPSSVGRILPQWWPRKAPQQDWPKLLRSNQPQSKRRFREQQANVPIDERKQIEWAAWCFERTYWTDWLANSSKPLLDAKDARARAARKEEEGQSSLCYECTLGRLWTSVRFHLQFDVRNFPNFHQPLQLWPAKSPSKRSA